MAHSYGSADGSDMALSMMLFCAFLVGLQFSCEAWS